MRPLSRQRVLAAIGAVVVALVAVARTSTAERAWITILSTTDLHGNLLPVDYYTGLPDARGLATVASVVRQVRLENPSGTLLIDSGDVIQGAPLEYVHNRVNNTPVDPMMLAMNALGYDAMTVGNHEYNFGLAVLQKAKGEARFPWLSANTYTSGSGDTFHQPYVVKVLNGVRVGVLGLTTPGIPFWENPENIAGLEFRDPLGEARRWVGVLRDRERVDLVVVAMHMGLEEDLATGVATPGQVLNENRALAIAREVRGVDVILCGHTHRELPGVSVNGALIVQANLWGRHLGRADVFLEKNTTGRWTVAARQARAIAMTPSTPVDAEIARVAEPYDRDTRSWLSRTIGQSDAELTAVDATFRDTALLDLVQRVQLEAGKADVSMVASFNADARVPKGAVTVREIAGLYVYDNTLVVLEVTGRQLKDALEHSARYFLDYVPGRSPADLVDRRIPAYNFDMAEGVTYDLDITKPAGGRIQNLRFHGQPLGPTTTLRLATNNYRVNGGGGYVMYKGAREVYRSSEKIRDLIIEWVQRHGRIPGEPTGNWRLIGSPP